MADKFVGKWKLTDSDNFNDYMKEVGVGMIARTGAAAVKRKKIFWKFSKI